MCSYFPGSFVSFYLLPFYFTTQRITFELNISKKMEENLQNKEKPNKWHLETVRICWANTNCVCDITAHNLGEKCLHHKSHHQTSQNEISVVSWAMFIWYFSYHRNLFHIYVRERFLIAFFSEYLAIPHILYSSYIFARPLIVCFSLSNLMDYFHSLIRPQSSPASVWALTNY